MFMRPRTSVSPGAQARKTRGAVNVGVAGQGEAATVLGEAANQLAGMDLVAKGLVEADHALVGSRRSKARSRRCGGRLAPGIAHEGPAGLDSTVAERDLVLCGKHRQPVLRPAAGARLHI